MLTPEDEERIRLEEVYRAEVVRRLTPEPTTTARFLGFFKSSFGTWILTSILAFGVTATFSHFRDRAAVQRERTATVQRLDREIELRLLGYDYLLSAMTALGTEQLGFNRNNVLLSREMQTFMQTGLYDTWLAVKGAESRSGTAMAALQSDVSLRGRSLVSLMVELEDNLDQDTERQAIRAATTFVLADSLFPAIESRAMGVTGVQAQTTRQILRTRVILPRWRSRLRY